MAEPERRQCSESWAERYIRLLQGSGLVTPAVLAEALQPQNRERRGLFSLAQCLEQPALLLDQVQKEFPHTDDRKKVRAYLSVLQQDLALSVIGTLALRLFRDGRAPIPQPERIFLAPPDQAGQTTSRWFMAPGAPDVSEATFIGETGRQVAHWYPVFRQAFGLSPGAYWSSIGLGLGLPFSAVWNLADPEATCRLAQQWLEAFRNDNDRFIDWIPAVFGEQNTAIPQRKGCCLKYLLPEGGYCGTCGVYRKERMAALSRQAQRQEPGQ